MLNTILGNIKRFNKNCRTILNKPSFCFWISEIYCFLRFGCGPNDYFRYEFYKKSNYERNKFITYRRSQRIIKKYNDPALAAIFFDKAKFNHTFKDYTAREWLDLRDVDKQKLIAFVEKHQKVIMKPLNGGQGRGIFTLSSKETDGFDLEKHRNYIAEEILIQNSKMSTLNPSSVNTIRVLTFKGDMIACALRTGGSDAVVDNLHANGVCGHIDIETGIVDVPCINNNYKKFLIHPKTGVIMVGFRIPNWEIVKKKIKEIAAIVPEVPYVGWDIAILEDDIALIEGNHDPGHDVVQMIGQNGLYDDIRVRM